MSCRGLFNSNDYPLKNTSNRSVNKDLYVFTDYDIKSLKLRFDKDGQTYDFKKFPLDFDQSLKVFRTEANGNTFKIKGFKLIIEFSSRQMGEIEKKKLNNIDKDKELYLFVFQKFQEYYASSFLIYLIKIHSNKLKETENFPILVEIIESYIDQYRLQYTKNNSSQCLSFKQFKEIIKSLDDMCYYDSKFINNTYKFLVLGLGNYNINNLEKNDRELVLKRKMIYTKLKFNDFYMKNEEINYKTGQKSYKINLVILYYINSGIYNYIKILIDIGTNDSFNEFFNLLQIPTLRQSSEREKLINDNLVNTFQYIYKSQIRVEKTLFNRFFSLFKNIFQNETPNMKIMKSFLDIIDYKEDILEYLFYYLCDIITQANYPFLEHFDKGIKNKKWKKENESMLNTHDLYNSLIKTYIKIHFFIQNRSTNDNQNPHNKEDLVMQRLKNYHYENDKNVKLNITDLHRIKDCLLKIFFSFDNSINTMISSLIQTNYNTFLIEYYCTVLHDKNLDFLKYNFLINKLIELKEIKVAAYNLFITKLTSENSNKNEKSKFVKYLKDIIHSQKKSLIKNFPKELANILLMKDIFKDDIENILMEMISQEANYDTLNKFVNII